MQPKLRQLPVVLDVDVRWFKPLVAEEEEPIRPDAPKQWATPAETTKALQCGPTNWTDPSSTFSIVALTCLSGHGRCRPLQGNRPRFNGLGHIPHPAVLVLDRSV